MKPYIQSSLTMANKLPIMLEYDNHHVLWGVSYKRKPHWTYQIFASLLYDNTYIFQDWKIWRKGWQMNDTPWE